MSCNLHGVLLNDKLYFKKCKQNNKKELNKDKQVCCQKKYVTRIQMFNKSNKSTRNVCTCKRPSSSAFDRSTDEGNGSVDASSSSPCCTVVEGESTRGGRGLDAAVFA